jgi:hypothetical protein
MAKTKTSLENLSVNKDLTARIYLDPNATQEEDEDKDYQYSGNVDLHYFNGVPYEHLIVYASGVRYINLEFTESLKHLSVNQFERLVTGLNEFLEFIKNEGN